MVFTGLTGVSLLSPREDLEDVNSRVAARGRLGEVLPSVQQMRRVLQKLGRPGPGPSAGTLTRRGPHNLPPTQHVGCPSSHSRLQGMAPSVTQSVHVCTHTSTHTHTLSHSHCPHHALKGIRGPSLGKRFFTHGARDLLREGGLDRLGGMGTFSSSLAPCQ